MSIKIFTRNKQILLLVVNSQELFVQKSLKHFKQINHDYFIASLNNTFNNTVRFQSSHNAVNSKTPLLKSSLKYILSIGLGLGAGLFTGYAIMNDQNSQELNGRKFRATKFV
jgi:hypothetical protein